MLHVCSTGYQKPVPWELRNTETDPRVSFLRTIFGQKCFSFRGVKLWNGLDAKSKFMKNFKQVKSCLQIPEHKGTEAFYSR